MSEAARLTPYSAEYLSLLARKKKLPAKKIGNVWYTNKETVEEYMRRQMLRTQIQNGAISRSSESIQPQQELDPSPHTDSPSKDISPNQELEKNIPVAFVPIPEVARDDIKKFFQQKTNVSSHPLEHPEIKKLRTMPLDIEEYKKGKTIPKPEYVHFIQRAGDQFFPQKAEQKNPPDISPIKVVTPHIPTLEKVSVSEPIKKSINILNSQPSKPEKAEIKNPPQTTTDKNIDAAPDLLAGIALLLDKKLSSLPSASLPKKNIVTRSFQNVFSKSSLLITAVVLALFFIIFPTPFASAFFDGTAAALTNTIKNANTVLGFRPGTHANDILLLDKDGNVSIMGHIETDSQFESYAAQGIAPIVVDSTTLVKNLNAEYLNGASTTDFTLAYVTKNGNVTTDDVSLLGNVEVGKTLLVKGATHLLQSLEIDGSISVFGDASISKSLSVSGTSYLHDIVGAGDLTIGNITASGNTSIGQNLSVRGGIEAGTGIIAQSGAFRSLSASNGFSARGPITLGSSNETLTINSSNIQLDASGNLNVDNVSAGDISANNLSIDSITASSSVSTNTIIAQNASTTNASSTNLLVENSTTTNATTTNLFAATFSSILSNITSLVADSISADALTAEDSTTTNATTTNFFSTNASTTNATSTNLFAAGFHALFGTIDTFDSTLANITSLVADSVSANSLIATNATTTNATTTNLAVSGNTTFSGPFQLSSIGTDMLLSLDHFGNVVPTSTPQVDSIIATSSTDTSTFAGNLSVSGNVTLGSDSTKQISVNGLFNTSLIPSDNITDDIGSPAFYWRTGYFDNLNVNSISAASTTIGGTNDNSFTINSGNVSNDAEDSFLIFKRGAVTPNALLSWNSTLKRFEFNQPLYISNQSLSPGIITLQAQGITGQTADVFQISSSSGASLLNVAASGNVGIGTSNPNFNLEVNGTASTTNFYATNSTTTNATSTNFFATTASSTNLFSTNLTTGVITSGLI
ncbi:MAG TPA: hypothetical protein VMR73_00195, partial [Candidatus Paceibacterota bacterium]|nr:hypothetical protein [Candidatus Paceibacterota bacterium]